MDSRAEMGLVRGGAPPPGMVTREPSRVVVLVGETDPAGVAYTRGGATPRFWTPTTPPTECWPEAPGEGGGQG